MSTAPRGTVSLPQELIDRLTAQAKSMNLSLPSYLEYLAAKQRRGHDADFEDGMKYVLKRYPDTMRKLAE